MREDFAVPNGKPGDHPIHDILEHRMPVFGGDVDGEIVRIAQEFGEKGIRRLEAFSRTPAFAECLDTIQARQRDMMGALADIWNELIIERRRGAGDPM